MGAAGLALALAGLFAPIRPEGGDVLLKVAMDFFHIPLFAALTLVLAGALRRTWAAIGFSLALIVISELVQPYFGRSESWVDALNGALGVGWGTLLWHRGKILGSPVWGMMGICLLGLVTLVQATPLWVQTRVYVRQQAQFPVLTDFHHEDDMYLWVPQPDLGSAAYRDSIMGYREGEFLSTRNLMARQDLNEGALQTRIYPGTDFVGLSLLLRGRAQDWRGYRSLVIHISSDSDKERGLGLRIDDGGDVSRLSMRYQNAVLLQPGDNSLRFPLEEIRTAPKERELDLGDIRRLAIFTAVDNQELVEFRIQRIVLE